MEAALVLAVELVAAVPAVVLAVTHKLLVDALPVTAVLAALGARLGSTGVSISISVRRGVVMSMSMSMSIRNGMGMSMSMNF